MDVEQRHDEESPILAGEGVGVDDVLHRGSEVEMGERDGYSSGSWSASLPAEKETKKPTFRPPCRPTSMQHQRHISLLGFTTTLNIPTPTLTPMLKPQLDVLAIEPNFGDRHTELPGRLNSSRKRQGSEGARWEKKKRGGAIFKVKFDFRAVVGWVEGGGNAAD